LKNTKYKVSVIIPCYNGEDFISTAIESLINQTIGFENIEVVIVNDASTDSSLDIINKYRENYENISVVSLDENSGVSVARNTGIENSSCDYIMFLDADDVYYSEMCEKLYKAITDNNADLAISRIEFYIDSKRKKNYPILDNYGDYIYIKSIYDLPELMSMFIAVWNKIFRKSIIEENNLNFPINVNLEDLIFSSKYFLYSNGIILLNNYFGIRYNVVSGSNSSTRDKSLESIMKYWKGWLIADDYLKEFNEFNQVTAENLVGIYKKILFSDLNYNTKICLLKMIRPYLKGYKYNTRLYIIPLWLNVLVNIIIKLSAINIQFPILISILISYFKK